MSALPKRSLSEILEAIEADKIRIAKTLQATATTATHDIKIVANSRIKTYAQAIRKNPIYIWIAENFIGLLFVTTGLKIFVSGAYHALFSTVPDNIVIDGRIVNDDTFALTWFGCICVGGILYAIGSFLFRHGTVGRIIRVTPLSLVMFWLLFSFAFHVVVGSLEFTKMFFEFLFTCVCFTVNMCLWCADIPYDTSEPYSRPANLNHGGSILGHSRFTEAMPRNVSDEEI